MQFGISFAQKGFKVTKDTKFKNEPLQSLMTKEVPDGLFVAAQTKFAANCGGESVCQFGKILMGKDSWLKFHGGINAAGVKVAAGMYGIPIKGDLKFNKVELFVEVGNRPINSCFEPHYESEASWVVFVRKMVYIHVANQSNFHMKCFALSLGLIMRFKATRKWPIDFFLKL